MNVRIVTPGGGIIHEIPDAAGLVQNFTGLPLNAPRTYYRNIDISQLEEGTYTTNAVWATPTGFADYATDSNVVIFSVATKEISIVSNKENVVRNYPFVVTITGDFKTDYYLYIKNASLAAANQYPTIKPGQPSVTITNVAFALASDPAADTLANNRACDRRRRICSRYRCLLHHLLEWWHPLYRVHHRHRRRTDLHDQGPRPERYHQM